MRYNMRCKYEERDEVNGTIKLERTCDAKLELMGTKANYQVGSRMKFIPKNYF